MPTGSAPNCKFIIDDANADWIYAEKGQFDFIHARYVYAGIDDWDKLWGQSYENLKPGGWVEHQEPAALFDTDDPEFKNSQSHFWQCRTEEASTKMGKRFNVAHEQKERMIKAGFKNVTQGVVDVPLGPWDPKNVELGKCALLNMVEAVRYVQLYTSQESLGLASFSADPAALPSSLVCSGGISSKVRPSAQRLSRSFFRKSTKSRSRYITLTDRSRKRNDGMTEATVSIVCSGV